MQAKTQTRNDNNLHIKNYNFGEKGTMMIKKIISIFLFNMQLYEKVYKNEKMNYEQIIDFSHQN